MTVGRIEFGPANRYKLRPPLEHSEQRRVVAWAELNYGKWPELRLLYAIPNGGMRSKAQTIYFKQEGLRPGCPDLCLPVPRKGYGALYVEMKRKGGRLSAEQEQWNLALNKAGNLAVVCWSYDEAVKTITDYLS